MKSRKPIEIDQNFSRIREGDVVSNTDTNGGVFFPTGPEDDVPLYHYRTLTRTFHLLPPDWEGKTIGTFSQEKEENNDKFIYLDNVYSRVLPNSWLVLQDQERYEAYQISETGDVSMTDFTLNQKVTRLNLDHSTNLDQFQLRETTAFAESDLLELSETPIEVPVNNENKVIDLERKVDGLKEYQLASITGEILEGVYKGKTKSEITQISKIETVENSESDNFTRITFTEISNNYKRDTVTFNFNIAKATHGETKEEVLGSGDPSSPLQQFTLKGNPLTYALTGDDKATSTLEIRASDILWKESPNLFELGPGNNSYITRLDDDGKTTVIFGDGKKGMRPSHGLENIRASYRIGIGKNGMVKAEQLRLLLSRPLGVRSVTNPVSSTGGTDPEVLEQARNNAPIQMLTMGRIVSLKDFEYFAMAFDGIGKALATGGWNGKTRMVHITIAGGNGENVTCVDLLYTSLQGAINKAKDPMQQFSLQQFNQKLFNLEAKILVQNDREFEKVRPNVEEQLRNKFSFENRQFGQDVTLSEIMTVIQQVDGVVAVDIDKLYVVNEEKESPAYEIPLNYKITSAQGKFSNDTKTLYDLVIINPDDTGVSLTEMTATNE